jgi:hypothetical protein
MTRFKSIRISILGSLAAGLLWLGPGAAYVAAQDNFITPGTRMDRFTSTVVTEPRTVIQFTGNFGTTIPGTSVKFTQHGTTAQAVVVTFFADWRKPQQGEVPQGGFASGVVVRPTIDGQVDPIGRRLGGVTLFESGGVATAFTVSNGTHGFTFVTFPVPPGDHVLEIQAFSDTLAPSNDQPNGTVVVRGRSTVVMHD